MLKLFAVTLVTLLLGGCATIERVPTEYAGPDAGKVVLGIGAVNGTSYSSYSLLFRKKNPVATTEKTAVGRLTYYQTNMVYKQAADYQSPTEGGVVLVQSLPPGDYEIYNFDIFFNSGTIQNNYGSRSDFSIPFSVKAGQTTYLGNYQANKLTGKNFFGLSLPAGAVFVVSDRIQSELAIAESKSKSKLAPAQNSTPQPSQIGNPFFASPQQAGDAK